MSSEGRRTASREGTSRTEQILPLSKPPVGQLPLWGRRVEFEGFFVELVPEGERIFNVRLDDTFASINFAPAEGTSSLAGDRIRPYDRRPFEFIVVPPLFPLSGDTRRAPEVLAFVIDFEAMRPTVARGLGVAPEELAPRVIIGEPAAFISTLAKKIRLQLTGEVSPSRYLESLCITLFLEMFRPLAEPVVADLPRASDRRDALDVLLKYIDANLDSDLTLRRLADLVGWSSDRLSRSFKAATGESPHNYVIQRRTDVARRLIADGQLNLAEIAQETGFSSQSHMTTTFKKVLGVTPGAIRRQP